MMIKILSLYVVLKIQKDDRYQSFSHSIARYRLPKQPQILLKLKAQCTLISNRKPWKRNKKYIYHFEKGQRLN